MFTPPRPPADGARCRAVGSSRRAAGRRVPDPTIKKGIRRVSATEFNVDRGVVDKILENQAELMRQARIVPEQENGKIVGIRLFGVRPDTLLGVLGMENGDRLQTINGFDMTSPGEGARGLRALAHGRPPDGSGQPQGLQHEPRLQHQMNDEAPLLTETRSAPPRSWWCPSRHSSAILSAVALFAVPQPTTTDRRERHGRARRARRRSRSCGPSRRVPARSSDRTRSEPHAPPKPTFSSPSRRSSPRRPSIVFAQRTLSRPGGVVTTLNDGRNEYGCHAAPDDHGRGTPRELAQVRGRGRQARERARAARHDRTWREGPRRHGRRSRSSSRASSSSHATRLQGRASRSRTPTSPSSSASSASSRASASSSAARSATSRRPSTRRRRSRSPRRTRRSSRSSRRTGSRSCRTGASSRSSRPAASRRRPRRPTAPARPRRTRTATSRASIASQHVSADEVSNVLGHFKTKDGDITVYEPGQPPHHHRHGSNIRRMMQIVEDDRRRRRGRPDVDRAHPLRDRPPTSRPHQRALRPQGQRRRRQGGGKAWRRRSARQRRAPRRRSRRRRPHRTRSSSSRPSAPTCASSSSSSASTCRRRARARSTSSRSSTPTRSSSPRRSTRSSAGAGAAAAAPRQTRRHGRHGRRRPSGVFEGRREGQRRQGDELDRRHVVAAGLRAAPRPSSTGSTRRAGRSSSRRSSWISRSTAPNQLGARLPRRRHRPTSAGSGQSLSSAA